MSSAVEELLLAGAPRARGWDRLLATYAAPAGELVERVSDLVAGLRGEVLDLGCGRGLHGREDVTGLDASFAMARAFCGRGVVGDAADPPFLAHAFDAVLLLNVLDSCAAPRLVLGQADALLAPGGTLVLSCAFAFADGLTPPGERFGPDDLERALTGEGGPFALDLRYRLVERRDRLSWRLRVSERVVHEHSCLLLVAVKEER
ncbi:MAG: class I SAM-dependent methyltransferase [Planctomycetota bacterium]|nr:MAG: class I SAM-dependent methyltransferase [Planctomycetota bacterium]